MKEDPGRDIAFPPDDCTATNPFMAFNATPDSNTYCINGQSVLTNALPGCGPGQQVIFDGAQFICQNASESSEDEQSLTIPSCAPGEVVTADGTSLFCVAQGGGGGGCENPDELYDGVHTIADCTAAGGTAQPVLVCGVLCELPGSSCPAGWTRHSNWGSTYSRTCSGQCTSCSTGGHPFADRSVESCIYTNSNGENCAPAIPKSCYALTATVGCY